MPPAARTDPGARKPAAPAFQQRAGMRRKRTVPSSVIALVVVTLLPVQLVAHCDVPIPGLSGHAEDHHPRSPDATASDPHGAIRGSDDAGTCAFYAPILTSRPDPEPHGPPLASHASLGAMREADASSAAPGLLPRGGSGHAPPPPLRI